MVKCGSCCFCGNLVFGSPFGCRAQHKCKKLLPKGMLHTAYWYSNYYQNDSYVSFRFNYIEYKYYFNIKRLYISDIINQTSSSIDNIEVVNNKSFIETIQEALLFN